MAADLVLVTLGATPLNVSVVGLRFFAEMRLDLGIHRLGHAAVGKAGHDFGRGEGGLLLGTEDRGFVSSR